MYNTRGGSWGQFGETNHFLPKSGQKTLFLAVMVPDHLTSEWAGTHNFRGIAKIHKCFGKFGTSASIWAMCKASIFNSVRLAATWIFFWEGHRKMQKTAFFWFSLNYLRFWYRNTYPGYHHVKANVLTLPKLWWFSGLQVFERELSLLEVGTLPKFWVRYHK